MWSYKCVSAKYLHVEPNSAIFMEYNIDMKRIILYMYIFHVKSHPWISQILKTAFTRNYINNHNKIRSPFLTHNILNVLHVHIWIV